MLVIPSRWVQPPAVRPPRSGSGGGGSLAGTLTTAVHLGHFTRLPESEQIKRLEDELDHLLAELQYAGEDLKNKLRNEMLPHIQEQIEELRRRLKELGREGDLKHVDRKMDQLTAEL